MRFISQISFIDEGLIMKKTWGYKFPLLTTISVSALSAFLLSGCPSSSNTTDPGDGGDPVTVQPKLSVNGVKLSDAFDLADADRAFIYPQRGRSTTAGRLLCASRRVSFADRGCHFGGAAVVGRGPKR